jgi:hypothetical protein
MVTKEQAQNLRYGQTLHYTGKHTCSRHVGPRGGVTEKIVNVRVSGKCQTWKTRPQEFSIPVKYGLYESSYLTHTNAADFHLEKDCPLRQSETTTQAAVA